MDTLKYKDFFNRNIENYRAAQKALEIKIDKSDNFNTLTSIGIMAGVPAIVFFISYLSLKNLDLSSIISFLVSIFCMIFCFTIFDDKKIWQNKLCKKEEKILSNIEEKLFEEFKSNSEYLQDLSELVEDEETNNLFMGIVDKVRTTPKGYYCRLIENISTLIEQNKLALDNKKFNSERDKFFSHEKINIKDYNKPIEKEGYLL